MDTSTLTADPATATDTVTADPAAGITTVTADPAAGITTVTTGPTATVTTHPAGTDADAARVAGMSDDELEERLCALAGTLAATEAEFLLLVAELDDRGLWGRPGLRSAAHWLSWRLGMRLGAAREHVRVGHALRELPAIATAFGAGQQLLQGAGADPGRHPSH